MALYIGPISTIRLRFPIIRLRQAVCCGCLIRAFSFVLLLQPAWTLILIPCNLESEIHLPPASVRVEPYVPDSTQPYVTAIGTGMLFTFPVGTTRPQIEDWLLRHGYQPDKTLGEYSRRDAARPQLTLPDRKK